jgi:hypothetical protein
LAAVEDGDEETLEAFLENDGRPDAGVSSF